MKENFKIGVSGARSNLIHSLEEELVDIELSDNSEYDPKESMYNYINSKKKYRKKTKKKYKYKKK